MSKGLLLGSTALTMAVLFAPEREPEGNILLETDDSILLETADKIVLEAT